MATDCSKLKFTESVYDMGYIPMGEQVIKTGLLAIISETGSEVTSCFDVTSDCDEVKFKDGDGNYTLSVYTVCVTEGQTTYIPFAVTSNTCGSGECAISYDIANNKMLAYYPDVYFVTDVRGVSPGDFGHTANSTFQVVTVEDGALHVKILTGDCTGDTWYIDDTAEGAETPITRMDIFTFTALIGYTLQDLQTGATATIIADSGNGAKPATLTISNVNGDFNNGDAIGVDGSPIKAYNNGTPQSTSITCSGSTKIQWYNATCDFQNCLLKSTEILCRADVDCEADICKDACLQNMIKLTMIDDVLEYKIAQKDWGSVNQLYTSAFSICTCGCGGQPILSPIGKQS